MGLNTLQIKWISIFSARTTLVVKSLTNNVLQQRGMKVVVVKKNDTDISWMEVNNSDCMFFVVAAASLSKSCFVLDIAASEALANPLTVTRKRYWSLPKVTAGSSRASQLVRKILIILKTSFVPLKWFNQADCSWTTQRPCHCRVSDYKQRKWH